MTKEQFLEEMKKDLAEKGLPLAEDAIVATIDSFERLAVKYLSESDNKLDDLGIPVIHSIAAVLKLKADAIDGAKG